MASRGLFRIHSGKFLTDRGVPCFKKSKAELVLLGKEAENRYSPMSLMITSNQKESGGGPQGKQYHCQSIGLDVSEKSTKDLYGQEVHWRNELVDVGPTCPNLRKIA